MRWTNLRLDEPATEDGAQLPLLERRATVRTIDTPEFRGVTFYEVQARSIINRVPGASTMPFRWTINPYRGCTHACVYCFARKSHTYLDFDAGTDFDSRIVVKINAPDLLRRELSRPSWCHESIAMGTNVDCYQRAEGRYQLMPGILKALTAAANPFSILTKGTLLLRDLDLLREAAERTHVGLAVSVGILDEDLWRAVEPGTPAPHRRLAMCTALREAGLDCAVLMAPILPFLTDTRDQLRATVRTLAEAGATSISPIVLHLRPGGAREWYHRWLAENHPTLVPRYRALYGDRSYAPRWYQERVTALVRETTEAVGLGRRGNVRSDPSTGPPGVGLPARPRRSPRRVTPRAASPATARRGAPSAWQPAPRWRLPARAATTGPPGQRERPRSHAR
jgi:DNA repair photolyase